MTAYPIWWSDTVTVYNKFTDPITGVITWYRHVIEGQCFWKDVGEKIKVGNVVLESDGIICRIPEQENFVERHLWETIPNDAMQNYLTLGLEDIIVKGEVSDEIDEYTSGNRSTDLITKYKKQGCLSIEDVSINTGVGLGVPHYHVRGI